MNRVSFESFCDTKKVHISFKNEISNILSRDPYHLIRQHFVFKGHAPIANLRLQWVQSV